MRLLESRPWLKRVLGAPRRAVEDPDVLRELAPGALVVAVVPWLYVCLSYCAGAAVFRDTGMFNYAAWCMLHGERIYKSIATPDGPLVYIIHAALQLIGGTSDQGLRRVDLAFHVVVSVVITLLVTPRAPRLVWLRRVTWAWVGASVWLSRLVEFGFGGTLQREGYYVALGLLGLSLVYASADHSRRIAAWMLCAGAFVAGWVMFGKHTGFVYSPLVVLGALLLPRNDAQPRAWRLRWVMSGLGLAVASAFLFIALVGSVRGFFFWYFRYNWVYYRFHEPVLITDLLGSGDLREYMFTVAVVTAAGLAGVMAGVLPGRAAVYAVAPALCLAGSVAQRKGWAYHFIPVSFSVAFFYVIVLALAWSSASLRDEWQRIRTAAAVGVLAFVAWVSFRQLQESPWMHRSEEHLDDAAVVQPREVARFVHDHTDANDRVFFFGDSPEVMFLAGRKPATPYHVSWMLELTNWPHDGEVAPTVYQQTRLAALQEELHADACSTLLANHPAVMLLQDGSVGKGGKGLDFVVGFCPAYKAILEKEYHDHPIGPYQVYLRNDRP